MADPFIGEDRFGMVAGFGREGIRYAIEENTELKQVTCNPRPLAKH